MMMTIRLRGFFLFVVLTIVTGASAKFVQEVELKDGTVLVGYVYEQQPGKQIVFHADRAMRDPKSRYGQPDKDYTLQWKDVKYIRRSAEGDTPWCSDKVTLKDGTTYVGQIEQQELGVGMTIRLRDTGKKVTVSSRELQQTEKISYNTGIDLWIDRQYTNRLKLTDQSVRDGLIVLQYRGEQTDDSYIELLHGTGLKERIFLPDIAEYIILTE